MTTQSVPTLSPAKAAPAVRRRWRQIRTYARFVKLEHTIFSLPLIYAGALLGADRWPSTTLVILILLAAIGGRVVAMGLNRLIDLEIDRHNPRTRQRDLPAGKIQIHEAWLVVIAGNVLYVIAAGLINPICLLLAPIPVLLFVGYPFLKRFTSLAHFGLGLAWSMGPLGAWFAAAQSFDRLRGIGWLWLFSFLWVAGFDIIYATMDEAFDRRAGLHSLPVRLGRHRALRLAAALHVAAFAALVVLWFGRLDRAPMALAWIAGIGVLLICQHLIAERKPEVAFFQLNSVIGFLVLGLVASGI